MNSQPSRSRMKWIYAAVLVMLFSVALPAWSDAPAEGDFHAKVDKIIHSYIDDLDAAFSSEIIISALKATNEANQGLSLARIKEIDAQWIKNSSAGAGIDELMINPCADELFKFQDKHMEFVEIFITDRYGLNVCQTNKTSDYYQADEKWWIDTYLNGKGRTYHGAIEYDDSAFSEVISIYIPIRDKQTGEVLGVSKSVIDIIFIKAELS